MTDIALLSELENKLKILIEELKHARSRAQNGDVPSKADEKLKRIEGKVKNLIQLLDQI